VDGVSCADLTAEPDQTGIYINHFASHRIVNLTAASHTVKLQYRSESTYAYAYASGQGSLPSPSALTPPRRRTALRR